LVWLKKAIKKCRYYDAADMRRVWAWITVRTLNMAWDIVAMCAVVYGWWNNIAGERMADTGILEVNIPYICFALPMAGFVWWAAGMMVKERAAFNRFQMVND
jgi:hypothetical protein